MKAIQPIPVIVISGFLGSGKTTLLNHLLPHLPRSALIINEFGTTPIDQDLIRQQDIAISTLVGGCLCCQVRDALAPVLRNLRMTWEAKEEKPFDRIIIETSGVANPEPILESLFNQRWLKERYSLQGMITTVAATQNDLFARFPEAVAQVAWADTVILTHTDRASMSQIKTLQQQIQQLAPSALKMNAIHGAVLPSLLTLFKDAPHYVPHAHPASIPEHPFHSISLQLEQSLTYQKLHTILTDLMNRYAKQVVRLKGIVYDPQQANSLIIQGANGVLYPPVILPAQASNDSIGRLVFITEGRADALAEDLMSRCGCILDCLNISQFFLI